MLSFLAFFVACVDNGTDSETRRLFSIEIGNSECSSDSSTLMNLTKKFYQDGTCDLSAVYGRMASKCGAHVREAHRNVSYKQLDSLLFVSLASMQTHEAILNAIDKCDEMFLYASGMYIYIERQDDGRGFK
jgi:hypothetical protein